MKNTARLISILLIAACLYNPVIASETIIGSVKNIEGGAYIIRSGERIPAGKGDRLYQSDTLITEDNSSMGVVLRDDTLISLGSNTELSINEFKFAPAQGELSILTRMAKGIVSYISGQIAKISPESARFETPVANIGVRGTKFLVKIEDT